MLCKLRRPSQASWEMLPKVEGVICSVQTNLCLRVDGLRATSGPGYSHAVLLKAIPLRQLKAKPDHGVTEAPAGRFLYHTTRLTPDPLQSAKEGQWDQDLRCSCDGTESTCKAMDKTPTKDEGNLVRAINLHHLGSASQRTAIVTRMPVLQASSHTRQKFPATAHPSERGI